MKRKILLLGALPLLLTSCSIIDWFTSLIEGGDSSTAISDASVQHVDGLMVAENLSQNYGGHSYAPAAPSTDAYQTKNPGHTIEDVKNTTYELPLPSSGTQRILVIPVKFTDYPGVATDKTRNDIYKTFFGSPSETGWESLASYYHKSSFKQLTIEGVVSEWYNCGLSTSELTALKNSSHDSQYDASWDVLEGAISWYKSTYNTKGIEFDNNHDGFIDGVWLVYGAPNYSNQTRLDPDLFWAYTYFDSSVFENIRYQSDLDKLKQNPVGYHYCWASYDHMYEGYGSNKVDAHTYIHETGHLMGLPDYYVAGSADDYTTNYGPMGWVDMMDANVIDHNAFSKMNFGWLNPYVLQGPGTVTLHPSASTGECLIIPTSNGWKNTVFDEYMLLEFYTPTELNASDSQSAYINGIRGFTTPGIRIYHVDARMVDLDASFDPTRYVTTFNGDTQRVDLANSNSSAYNFVKGSVGNHEHRLIQMMDCTQKRNFDVAYDLERGKKVPCVADNSSLFTQGKSFDFATYRSCFPRAYFHDSDQMNNGGTFDYRVTVTSITSSAATLTITAA